MTSLERTMAEILGVILIIGGFALWERHKGAVSCENHDKAAVVAQETHNAQVQKSDAVIINEEAQTYAKTLADPTPADVPHVSLCHYTPSALPQAPAPGPLPHEAPPDRKPDTSDPIDVGPPLVKVGTDADAKIKALQDYIQRVCFAP